MRLNHRTAASDTAFATRSMPCYLTDTEHVAGRIDEKLIGFISGADAIIYDRITDVEFSHFRGYGHSIREEGVRLCEAAGSAPGDLHHRPGRR
jgi:phosphoribosyl 1,2-cyclic phosphodiesterase